MPESFDTLVKVPEDFRMTDSAKTFQGLRPIARQEEVSSAHVSLRRVVASRKLN